MGDGFYRSKDPTNSIKVLKENLQKTNQNNGNNTEYTCIDNNTDEKRYTYIKHNEFPSLH